eukprot:4893933-Pyramimonas_sp.AAC.1
MKATAGLGVDFLSPVDLQRLPLDAMIEFTDILKSAETLLAWPAQTQLIATLLTPKKSQGDRGIGMISMVGRLWSRVREPIVKQWSKEEEQAWNAAVARNSCLREAYLHAIDEEFAHWMRMEF